MTSKEQKTVDELFNMMALFQTELRELKQNTNNHIDEINKKVDAKHIPMNLEDEINRGIKNSIAESIANYLKGYNTPLNVLTKMVVDSKTDILKDIISEAFDTVIEAESFKQSIIEAFSHKISRSIISNNDGLFDKVSNELKKDSRFKAKMTLAVANVVEECLNESE